MGKLQVIIFIALCFCLSVVYASKPVLILATSAANPPFAKLFFVDEFDKGMLEPEWEWVDPKNDSSKRFGTREGWLELSTVSGNDLWSKANLDAPRLLRFACGNFALETKVAPSPERILQAGGMVVWKDKENFIRFERGTWGYDTIILQKCEGGLFQHLGDWFFRGNPIYLRLERRGEKFKALYGVDGENWNECSQFDLRINDPVKVGLHAVCLGSRIPLTVTDFDYFKIFWTEENEPYTTSNVRELKAEELQTLQEAEDEKLIERANYVLSKTASERKADLETVIIEPKTGLKFTKIYSDDNLDIIPRPYWLIISPDGKFIFSPLGLKSEVSGWVVPLKEGQEPFKPVPEIEGGIYGSWSPDMRQFAFVSRQTGDLFVMPVSPETGRATGAAKKLVEGTGEEYQIRKSASPLSWTPDDKQIAFSWGRSGNFDIWTIPATGGEPTQITDDPRWERWPVWSSDGASIVFARQSDVTQESKWDVWMVSVAGGEPVKIMENAYGGLSPNGKWFAFEQRTVGGGSGILRLSDKRQFNIISPQEVGGFFAWSHEGNKLLFYKSGWKGHSALKVVPVYGGPSLELGKSVELWAETQIWSTDGKFIITGGEENFWIIPTAGGIPTKLEIGTEPKLEYYPEPPFSPDLKRFAFIPEDRSLWMSPVSMEKRRTTGEAVKITEKATIGGSWSPDSKRIAFSSSKEGHADIWTASVEGGKLTRLTDTPEEETKPFWSPDGEMIAYNRGKSLWVIPASGGKSREIAQEGSSPTWSPDGKELGFIAGDSSYISIITLATNQVRRMLDLKALVFKEPDVEGGCWNLIWSPDGKKLAFLSYARGRYQVWAVSVTGEELTELANDDAGMKFCLYWSPDSKKLSYNSEGGVKVGMGAIWEADMEELLSNME